MPRRRECQPALLGVGEEKWRREKALLQETDSESKVADAKRQSDQFGGLQEKGTDRHF